MGKENFDVKSEVDPTLAKIVKQIQDKEAELTRLQNDSKFEPAVKARLAEEIGGEIKVLSGQKMEALANLNKKILDGRGGEAESDPFSDAVERADSRSIKREDNYRETGRA